VTSTIMLFNQGRPAATQTCFFAPVLTLTFDLDPMTLIYDLT